MDNKDKLISRQVALKGAIELACNSNMHYEGVSEVLATAEILQNWILSPFSKVAENPVVNTPMTQPSPPTRESSQSPVGQGELKCPSCASKVYDNRADKKSDKSPNFNPLYSVQDEKSWRLLCEKTDGLCHLNIIQQQ